MLKLINGIQHPHFMKQASKTKRKKQTSPFIRLQPESDSFEKQEKQYIYVDGCTKCYSSTNYKLDDKSIKILGERSIGLPSEIGSLFFQIGGYLSGETAACEFTEEYINTFTNLQYRVGSMSPDTSKKFIESYKDEFDTALNLLYMTFAYTSGSMPKSQFDDLVSRIASNYCEKTPERPFWQRFRP